MKSYIETTGQKIIDSAKGCGDYPPSYYNPGFTYRVLKSSFIDAGMRYHKVYLPLSNRWEWRFSIPESWYEKFKEE